MLQLLKFLQYRDSLFHNSIFWRGNVVVCSLTSSQTVSALLKGAIYLKMMKNSESSSFSIFIESYAPFYYPLNASNHFFLRFLVFEQIFFSKRVSTVKSSVSELQIHFSFIGNFQHFQAHQTS